MPLQAQTKTTRPFALDNRYPELPTLPSLTAAETKLFEDWWYKVREVLDRQTNQIATALDKKADKP